MPKYISLLRGVNVGGRTVKMDRLRAAFEGLGFANARTYIQSGNVLFDTGGGEPGDGMRVRIEETLRKEFGFDIAVILLPSDELAALVAANPYAGRKLAGIDRVHTTVFQSEPQASAVSALRPEQGSRDEFRIICRTAFVLCHEGYAHTPYSNLYFEKGLKEKATTRNMDTMEKLVGMYGKD
jgi:uncharacterized protein (DUF1697 family)